MELHAGSGIAGDCHFLNNEKQIALLSSNARDWMAAQEVKGLCFSRMQENILIKKINFSELTQGVILNTEDAKIEILKYSKKCFAECDLVKDALPCELKLNIRFAKVILSGTVHVGDRIWIDENEKNY